MRDAAIDTHRQSGRSPARPRASGAPPLDGMLGEGLATRGPNPVSRKGDGITSAVIAAQRLGGGRGVAAGRGRGQGSSGLMARLRARLPRVRPFKALTTAAFSVALVGIVANAMVFQRGRHPAPLFGLGQSLDGQSDAAQHTVAALTPPPAPAPAERTGTIPAPAAVEPAPAPVAVAPKPAPHVAVKPHHDGVTALRARAGGDKTVAERAAAEPHSRPGHAASKPVTKVEPKTDPVEKLLAEPVQKPKPSAKAPDAKPVADKAAGDHHVTEAVASTRPHHRVAAAETPADVAKKAAKPE